jgi:hypothetical protein
MKLFLVKLFRRSKVNFSTSESLTVTSVGRHIMISIDNSATALAITTLEEISDPESGAQDPTIRTRAAEALDVNPKLIMKDKTFNCIQEGYNHV